MKKKKNNITKKDNNLEKIKIQQYDTTMSKSGINNNFKVKNLKN